MASESQPYVINTYQALNIFLKQVWDAFGITL